MDNIILLSGNSNINLARNIGKYLKIPLTSLILDKYNNGEIRCQICSNIRNKDIFIINTGNASANDIESLGEKVRERVYRKFNITQSRVNSAVI